MNAKPTRGIQRAIAGCLFALLTTVSRVGSTQTDAATAEALFREGKKLMEQRNFAAACPRLAESQRLDPATGTLLALAMCHEGEGKTASAWVEYADVAGRARQEGRSDREQAAREKGAALEPRLSTLAIAPSPKAAAIGGLVIKRDGAVVGAGAWQAAVPVDPGEHKVEASAPGKRAWKTTVAVGTNDKKSVEIPELVDDIGGGAAGAPAIAGGSSGGGLAPFQVGGIATAAAGVVAAGVGTYYGLRARTLNDESKSDCDGNVCGPDGKQKRLDAISAGNVSTIAFAVGGAFVAGGAAMFFLGRAKEGGAEAHVTATAFAGGGGLLVGGRF